MFLDLKRYHIIIFGKQKILVLYILKPENHMRIIILFMPKYAE